MTTYKKPINGDLTSQKQFFRVIFISIKDDITKNEHLLDTYSNLDSSLKRLKLYFKLNSKENFIDCLKRLKKDIKYLIDELE